MVKKRATSVVRRRPASRGIELMLSGYKSIHDTARLNIKPLTLVSGVNSSGKSSFMQPFLLLKQTLEASFDPGPILVYGPNVQLTDWSQALSRGKSKDSFSREMTIGVSVDGRSVMNSYDWSADAGLVLVESSYGSANGLTVLRRNSTEKVIEEALGMYNPQLFGLIGDISAREKSGAKGRNSGRTTKLSVDRYACFLEPRVQLHAETGSESGIRGNVSSGFQRLLRSIIHVPGLRGNPLRTYTSSAAGGTFAGTMEQYVASLISKWQSGTDREKETLRALSLDLEKLGLTWKIDARKINDASVELRVGRLPRAQQGGAQDLVNIVDVGFGVSQTLPILVALRAASRGQIVYIEQPEIHLHPRAQSALGELLVDAANRGIYVVVETHSTLILRAVQTAIASKVISHEHVGLNWFSRDPDTGFTKISVADLDRFGRFGDWPVDFDEVAEESDWAFVKSVQEASGD